MELLSAFVVPLVIDRSSNLEALPEHFDAETTVATAYKLVHSGNDNENNIQHCHEKICNLSFHFCLSLGIKKAGTRFERRPSWV